MITRTIQGVPFRVISPSFYELASQPCVDISFIGDSWVLHCPDADGEPLLRLFPSLDDAVALLALAIKH